MNFESNIRRLPIASLFIAVLLSLVTGCDAPASQPVTTLPTIQMPIGKKTFTLEVADTEKTRETGLMFRDSMPDDHGMIFVFSDEIVRNFWMKNTHIPLDIVYVAADGTIVSIKTMQAYDLRNTSSDGKAKFAIELNVGAPGSAGISAGEKLSIPATVVSKD